MRQDGGRPVTFRQTLWAVALILGGTAALYGHTLNAPFYLDDQWAIVDRHLLRDLPATLSRFFGQRGLTNLTFALNYRLSGLSLPPLHLVNIALHAGCTILVWRLLLRLISGRWLPLLGALLFLAHPLQTQAVTYLVQRATVLGTFFALLTLLLYLQSRDALSSGHCRCSAAFLRPYLGAVLAGACAVLAKENTATLPLALLIHDRLFPRSEPGDWRRALGGCLPFCLAPLLLAGGFLLRAGSLDNAVLFFPLESLRYNAPLNYLVTQFSVVWVYLRLLFFPYGQALEHNYPVAAELVTGQSLLALAGLLLVAVAVWRLRHRRPLLAFGMAWFVLGLAVESSVIPLDPLFEHRLYLPMFGFVLALLDGVPALLGQRRGALLFVLALLLCLPLTWRRNALWNDPVAFYRDNLQVVPFSERAMTALAKVYEERMLFTEQRLLLEEMVRAYPGNPLASANLAELYSELNRPAEAFVLLEESLKRFPASADLYEAAAKVARNVGDVPRAVAYLQRGIDVPQGPRGLLLNDLGVLYSETGESALAERAFRESLALDDASPVARLNLGKEYYLQGRWAEAIAAFGRAAELDPGNPEPLEGLGRAALKLQDAAAARLAAARLEKIDRAAWQRLRHEIEIANGVPGTSQ